MHVYVYERSFAYKNSEYAFLSVGVKLTLVLPTSRYIRNRRSSMRQKSLRSLPVYAQAIHRCVGFCKSFELISFWHTQTNSKLHLARTHPTKHFIMCWCIPFMKVRAFNKVLALDPSSPWAQTAMLCPYATQTAR